MNGRFFPLIVFCLFLLLSLVPQSASADGEYRVQRGDTLSAIAQKTGITINELKKINHLKSDFLQINQTLLISMVKKERRAAGQASGPSVYEVQKGDCLSRIARKTGVSVNDLRKINHLSGIRLQIGQKLLLEEKKEIETQNDLSSDEKCIASTDKDEQNQESEKEPDDLAASLGTSAQNNQPCYDTEKLLGKWRYPEEQHLLVKVALGFLGAPYRRGGCSVRGMDCSGFVKKIYALFDVDLPRTAAAQSTVGMKVAKSDLTEGDLIFFKTKKRINHVGIYIGENKFVHAALHNKAVKIDSLDSSYYKRHYKSAVRLKGSEESPANESSASLQRPAISLFAQTSFTEAHR